MLTKCWVLFLRGQLLVMIALAIIYSLGLTFVGLKFAVAIGVVAGLVSFVPYLGLVFGIALASLTVALEPEPLWQPSVFLPRSRSRR